MLEALRLAVRGYNYIYSQVGYSITHHRVIVVIVGIYYGVYKTPSANLYKTSLLHVPSGFYVCMKKYVDDFLRWKQTHIQKKSVDIYRLHLYRFAKIAQGTIITEPDVLKYRNSLIQFDGNNIAYAMRILKSFARYLSHKNHRSLSPVFIKPPRIKPKLMPYVTESDVTMMCETLDEDDFTELTKKLIVHFLWNTGIRVSELCALDLNQTDTATRSAIIETRKSNMPRSIVWSKETHDLLVRYLGVRLCLNRASALFITLKGGSRITPRTIQRWMDDIVKKAGIEKEITPHSFRHGKVHDLLKKKASTKAIQLIVGHVSVTSIENYLRLNTDESRDLAEGYI